jgi:hypothetical protein
MPLLIIPTYAKVSSSLFTNTLSLPQWKSYRYLQVLAD